MFKSVSVNGSAYNYYYDALNRRRYKSYPTGIADEYFYDLGHQMLVDQGSSSNYPFGSTPVLDEYVWLGGRPVAIIRSKLTSTWARQSDGTGVCTRSNYQVGMCNIYFPVTDVVGKPVLMLNRAGQISGTGDYDPFGQFSRVFIDAETSHPYGTTNGVFATLTQAVPSGFDIKIQLRVDLLDLDWQDPPAPACVTGSRVWDLLEIRDVSGTVLGSYGGVQSFVSGWTSAPGGTVQLAVRNPGTCSFTPDPTGTCTSTCDGIARPRSKSGVVAGSYEYRLFEVGAGLFWTPLRFPGQYYDAESDLFENWNRYYDATTGRYLQPEPLLTQGPHLTRDKDGQLVRASDKAHPLRIALPSYAYARNNPIHRVDINGLSPNDWDPDCSSTEGECTLHALHAQEAWCRCKREGGDARLTTDNSGNNSLVTGVECAFYDRCEEFKQSWFEAEPFSIKYWSLVGGGDEACL